MSKMMLFYCNRFFVGSHHSFKFDILHLITAIILLTLKPINSTETTTSFSQFQQQQQKLQHNLPPQYLTIDDNQFNYYNPLFNIDSSNNNNHQISDDVYDRHQHHQYDHHSTQNTDDDLLSSFNNNDFDSSRISYDTIHQILRDEDSSHRTNHNHQNRDNDENNSKHATGYTNLWQNVILRNNDINSDDVIKSQHSSNYGFIRPPAPPSPPPLTQIFSKKPTKTLVVADGNQQLHKKIVKKRSAEVPTKSSKESQLNSNTNSSGHTNIHKSNLWNSFIDSKSTKDHLNLANRHLVEFHLNDYQIDNSKLLTLNLSNNRLETFTISSIDKNSLKNLVILDLTKNQLQQFDFDAIQLKNLTILNLTSNHLSNFTVILSHLVTNTGSPDDNEQMIKTRDAHVNNGINQSETEQSQEQIQLKILILQNNCIKSLKHFKFHQFNRLQEIDLSCNQIESLEEDFFAEVQNLKTLILSHNRLGGNQINPDNRENITVDRSKPNMYGARKEYWDQQQSIFQQPFYNLLNIETLILSFNNIRTIDFDTFLVLPNLQYLDLSNNNIHGESVKSLSGIPDLIGLSLAYNYELGDSLQEFVASWSLKELDISGTGLCRVPAALAQSVRALKLRDNWLASINCGDLDSYPLLQYLDLSHSNIEEIEDDALGRLEMLETLFLDHNNLKRIPISLPTSLENLFLQYNQIIDVQPQYFQGLYNLKVLDLSGNKLLYLPGLPLPKLLTLNLQSSELKGLSQSLVKASPKLRDLYLDDNPIKCSDLMGIAEWASSCHEENFYASSSGASAAPGHSSGKTPKGLKHFVESSYKYFEKIYRDDGGAPIDDERSCCRQREYEKIRSELRLKKPNCVEARVIKDRQIKLHQIQMLLQQENSAREMYEKNMLQKSTVSREPFDLNQQQKNARISTTDINATKTAVSHYSDDQKRNVAQLKDEGSKNHSSNLSVPSVAPTFLPFFVVAASEINRIEINKQEGLQINIPYGINTNTSTVDKKTENHSENIESISLSATGLDQIKTNNKFVSGSLVDLFQTDSVQKIESSSASVLTYEEESGNTGVRIRKTPTKSNNSKEISYLSFALTPINSSKNLHRIDSIDEDEIGFVLRNNSQRPDESVKYDRRLYAASKTLKDGRFYDFRKKDTDAIKQNNKSLSSASSSSSKLAAEQIAMAPQNSFHRQNQQQQNNGRNNNSSSNSDNKSTAISSNNSQSRRDFSNKFDQINRSKLKRLSPSLSSTTSSVTIEITTAAEQTLSMPSSTILSKAGQPPKVSTNNNKKSNSVKTEKQKKQKLKGQHAQQKVKKAAIIKLSNKNKSLPTATGNQLIDKNKSKSNGSVIVQQMPANVNQKNGNMNKTYDKKFAPKQTNSKKFPDKIDKMPGTVESSLDANAQIKSGKLSSKNVSNVANNGSTRRFPNIDSDDNILNLNSNLQHHEEEQPPHKQQHLSHNSKSNDNIHNNEVIRTDEDDDVDANSVTDYEQPNVAIKRDDNHDKETILTLLRQQKTNQFDMNVSMTRAPATTEKTKHFLVEMEENNNNVTLSSKFNSILTTSKLITHTNTSNNNLMRQHENQNGVSELASNLFGDAENKSESFAINNNDENIQSDTTNLRLQREQQQQPQQTANASEFYYHNGSEYIAEPLPPIPDLTEKNINVNLKPQQQNSESTKSNLDILSRAENQISFTAMPSPTEHNRSSDDMTSFYDPLISNAIKVETKTTIAFKQTTSFKPTDNSEAEDNMKYKLNISTASIDPSPATPIANSAILFQRNANSLPVSESNGKPTNNATTLNPVIQFGINNNTITTNQSNRNGIFSAIKSSSFQLTNANVKNVNKDEFNQTSNKIELTPTPGPSSTASEYLYVGKKSFELYQSTPRSQSSELTSANEGNLKSNDLTVMSLTTSNIDATTKLQPSTLNNSKMILITHTYTPTHTEGSKISNGKRDHNILQFLDTTTSASTSKTFDTETKPLTWSRTTSATIPPSHKNRILVKAANGNVAPLLNKSEAIHPDDNINYQKQNNGIDLMKLYAIESLMDDNHEDVDTVGNSKDSNNRKIQQNTYDDKRQMQLQQNNMKYDNRFDDNSNNNDDDGDNDEFIEFKKDTTELVKMEHQHSLPLSTLSLSQLKSNNDNHYNDDYGGGIHERGRRRQQNKQRSELLKQEDQQQNSDALKANHNRVTKKYNGPSLSIQKFTTMTKPALKSDNNYQLHQQQQQRKAKTDSKNESTNIRSMSNNQNFNSNTSIDNEDAEYGTDAVNKSSKPQQAVKINRHHEFNDLVHHLLPLYEIKARNTVESSSSLNLMHTEQITSPPSTSSMRPLFAVQYKSSHDTGIISNNDNKGNNQINFHSNDKLEKNHTKINTEIHHNPPTKFTQFHSVAAGTRVTASYSEKFKYKNVINMDESTRTSNIKNENDDAGTTSNDAIKMMTINDSGKRPISIEHTHMKQLHDPNQLPNSQQQQDLLPTHKPDVNGTENSKRFMNPQNVSASHSDGMKNIYLDKYIPHYEAHRTSDNSRTIESVDEVGRSGASGRIATPEQWSEVRSKAGANSLNHPGLFIIIGITVGVLLLLGVMHMYRCHKLHRQPLWHHYYSSNTNNDISAADDDHYQYQDHILERGINSSHKNYNNDANVSQQMPSSPSSSLSIASSKANPEQLYCQNSKNTSLYYGNNSNDNLFNNITKTNDYHDYNNQHNNADDIDGYGRTITLSTSSLSINNCSQLLPDEPSDYYIEMDHRIPVGIIAKSKSSTQSSSLSSSSSSASSFITNRNQYASLATGNSSNCGVIQQNESIPIESGHLDFSQSNDGSIPMELLRASVTNSCAKCNESNSDSTGNCNREAMHTSNFGGGDGPRHSNISNLSKYSLATSSSGADILNNLRLNKIHNNISLFSGNNCNHNISRRSKHTERKLFSTEAAATSTSSAKPIRKFW